MATVAMDRINPQETSFRKIFSFNLKNHATKLSGLVTKCQNLISLGKPNPLHLHAWKSIIYPMLSNRSFIPPQHKKCAVNDFKFLQIGVGSEMQLMKGMFTLGGSNFGRGVKNFHRISAQISSERLEVKKPVDV